MSYKDMDTEDLLEAWHAETEIAEGTDDWEKVAEIEQEMIRRGMDPAEEAQR
jgi:hypothetical protein